jgi:hypothetical protein
MTSTLVSATPAQQASQNTVLADLVDAIDTYPETYLTVEIYDVDPPGSGTGINAGEDVTFKVHVHNSGPLDVVQLTLLIESRPGADGVKLHGGTAFNPSLISAPIELAKGHMADGEWVDPPDGHFHFKAGPPSGSQVELVRVSVNTWDASLNHPLNSHSDPAPSVEDTLAKTVLKA